MTCCTCECNYDTDPNWIFIENSWDAYPHSRNVELLEENFKYALDDNCELYVHRNDYQKFISFADN